MSFLSIVIELILFNGSEVMVTYIAENVSIMVGKQRILYPVLKIHAISYKLTGKSAFLASITCL